MRLPFEGFSQLPPMDLHTRILYIYTLYLYLYIWEGIHNIMSPFLDIQINEIISYDLSYLKFDKN